MRQLIAGNWKMHGLSDQLPEIELMAACVASRPLHADVLLCVPATLISRAVQVAAGRLPMGGEDCHAEASGSFTGDVSAEMLKDAGATTVIVGHSERRRLHQETDAVVAAKALAGFRAGLSIIVCIGETQEQRSNGRALTSCASQLAGSLFSAPSKPAVTAIAYEPLWAIGSGHPPSSEQVTEMHQHIRSCLMTQFGGFGSAIRILYGGSVTSDNAAEILSIPEVGGLLIGGASLKADKFDAILGLTDR
ncbi:triose-phosphate isomerase (plasmid) [Lichenicola cladoniae]|uniref:Triosephosphate isomerase n=1 Tax=Lichenicola cladoniae TaxID=1484109 RepID=A0A6M8HY84_9PROT|nr:triose-phosphate isomerase [Lichenicola cladoniae]NPD66765.1 triose-phosphate isomerase [Acetobacteraceae bacterium]QKE93534.1 triose-phosphate isomerase [Lichenicola cladoniae]